MYYGKAPLPPIEKWSLAFKTTLVWLDNYFSKGNPFEKNENNFVANKIHFPAGVCLVIFIPSHPWLCLAS